MKIFIILMTFPICLFTSLKVRAQVSLNVPNNTQNTRFYSDIFNIHRPGLSIIGFDNGGNNDKGYGLKQILEKLYNGTANSLMVQNFNQIVQLANEDLTDPFNTPDKTPLTVVNNNSNKLQARAFIALARYVLHKNGITEQIPDSTQIAPDYNTAISKLHAAFLKPENWLLADASHQDKKDPVKWTRTVGNYARALDLYLALENAFDYYGGADQQEYNNQYSTVLLSKTQKEEVLSELAGRIDALDNYLHSDAVFGTGVQIYEAEPGNRPMKMFLAMGYGALTLQNYNPSTQNIPNVAQSFLQDAFRSGGLQESQNSIKYWSYQTHNGKRFWAEGPYYFEFTLNDVVPFWHAIRANNMLNWNGNNISDPFNNGWFLNPLDWLADLTTPYGELPPLDDGNKRSIRYANLLRWNNTYGNANIGEKFAWIGDKIKNKNGNLDGFTLLVQLAMPHISENNGIAPLSLTGNENSYTPGNNSEQQLTLRYQDASGSNHYLLLNGESGDAITRGEGHEQPDQMQLLYYIDGKSFLMDRGYDKATPTSNSTYNAYSNHNIMFYSNAYLHGGIPSPHLASSLGRKQSDHQEVDELYYKNPSNKIVEFYSKVELRVDLLAILGRYKRDVLFIQASEPYIIDFNSLYTQVYDPQKYNDEIDNLGNSVREFLFYHGFSNTFSQSSDWKYWDITGANKNLYMYLRSIEFGDSTIGSLSVAAEERNIDPINIKRAAFPYPDNIPNPISGYYDEFNPFTRFFNTVGIFKADDSSPVDPQTLFTYQSDKKTPYQGWYWKPNINTVDVIVKRSKVNLTRYNQSIDFTVNENNIFIPGLSLPAGKDYGFARFRNNNGVWELDTDYQVNLNQNAYIYANGDVINTETFPQNASLLIPDNAMVYINGDVTLQQGTTVYLGKGAQIKVNTNGSITASHTTFQTPGGSVAPADRWNTIKLLSDNNSFTFCDFKGAKKAVYVASSGNIFKNGYFIDNGTGLWLNSGDATLRGVDIIQTDDQSGTNKGAVVRGTATLYTSRRQNVSFNTEFLNLYRGVDISDFGRLVAYETIFQGNNYHVYMSGNATLNSSGFVNDRGYNSYRINPATIYDIYNLTPGSGAGAGAAKNWWGSPVNPPADSRFFGSVDRSLPLSCDPTNFGQHCPPIGQGDPCDSDFPCLSDDFGQTSTPSYNKSIANTASTGIVNRSVKKSSALEENIKAYISHVYQFMQNHPGDVRITNLIKNIHDLLVLFDWKGNIRSWAEFDFRLKVWRNLLMHPQKNNKLTFENESGHRSFTMIKGLKKHRSVLKELGRTALLINLDDLLHQAKYNKVLRRVKTYEHYFHDPIRKVSLLSAKAVAWEQTGHFNKVLSIYNEIEQKQRAYVLERGGNANAVNHGAIKAELVDSMTARGQSKVVSGGDSELLSKKKFKQTLPDTFDVNAPYPNPFSYSLTIPIDVPKKGALKILIYDMLGRKVATLKDEIRSAGHYDIPYEEPRLSSGIYIIRVQFKKQTVDQKITFIK